MFEELKEERTAALQYLPKRWQTFFNKFEEIETIKVSQWKPVHILAYFDKRFREHYKKNFAYTCKPVPGRCVEIVLVKQMIAMLGTTNMRTIKEYIDWVFDEKIIPRNMKIRTLAFFGTAGMANEFFQKKAAKDRITRSSIIPDSYKQVANECGVSAATYGDLAFIKMAINSRDDDSIKNYREFFDRLYSIGFEDVVIKELL